MRRISQEKKKNRFRKKEQIWQKGRTELAKKGKTNLSKKGRTNLEK
jgi:hypothetical protein